VRIKDLCSFIEHHHFRPAFIIATKARAARHPTHNDNGANIMLFMVQMQVNIPATLDKAVADQLKKDEKEMSQSCSAKASGATCGAWSGSMPT
jgi:hypothetical protein